MSSFSCCRPFALHSKQKRRTHRCRVMPRGECFWKSIVFEDPMASQIKKGGGGCSAGAKGVGPRRVEEVEDLPPRHVCTLVRISEGELDVSRCGVLMSCQISGPGRER